MDPSIITISSNLKNVVLKNLSKKKKIKYNVNITKSDNFTKENTLKAKKILNEIQKNIYKDFDKINIHMKPKDKNKTQTDIINNEIEKYLLTMSLPYIKKQKYKVVFKS